MEPVVATTNEEKPARHRSPNYPGVSLKTAVAKISQWFKEDGIVASPRDAALKHMGFEKFTGDAGRLLSALKSFGLVQETEGRIKLTQRGIDIVARPDGDPKRSAALNEAALSPDVYKALLKDYPNGLPSDTTLKSELVAAKKFNPKVVDDFTKDFKATLAFAGLSNTKVLESVKEGERNTQLDKVEVGDFVQWESQGVLQLPKPMMVREVSEDGKWAFLEGSNTGLPVKELSTVEVDPLPPPPPTLADDPPRPRTMVDAQGTAGQPAPIAPQQDVFSLPEGKVTIQWPSTLTAESFADLSEWLDLLKRRIGRSVPFKLTKRDVIAKLRAGFKIHGDPESDTPCSLIDLSQKGMDWVPLVPAEMLRQLLEDGILAENSGTGRRYFELV
jgi:hypothetical protein